MNERDRNREEQLDRLFQMAGPESAPYLAPDPGLPARLRRLVESGSRATRPARWTPRWAWVPLAGVAFAASVVLGGFIGYRAWESSMEPVEITGEAELLVTAWSQSAVEDLRAANADMDEVEE